MRCLLFAIFGCLALEFVAGGALATPSITRVEGTITQGQILVIHGTGFGPKAQAAPLRWDDFQDGVAGDRLLDRDQPGGSVWDLQDSADRRPAYSTAQQRVPNDIVVLQDFSESNNKSIGVLNYPSSRWYVSFWTYRDDYAGTAMRCTNTKLYGIFTGSNWNGYPQGRWDEYWFNNTGHMNLTDCNTGTAANRWHAINPNFGRWFRVERYLDMGTALTADGYHAGWIDLHLVNELSGVFRPAGCETSMMGDMMVGFYFRTEDGSGALLRQYISEMYVDTTPARVELGDAPDWASCHYREIQVPVAWSDSDISVTLNTGIFANDAQIFLFVVDDSRSVSTGFLVTPGQTGNPIQD